MALVPLEHSGLSQKQDEYIHCQTQIYFHGFFQARLKEKIFNSFFSGIIVYRFGCY